MDRSKGKSQFWILLSVFFFWGFVAASNTVLIGLFKKNFELTQSQSQWVDLAFYLSYFAGAALYLCISYLWTDPLNRIGYKKGLVLGLLISAVGAFCFIPAAQNASFGWMLFSLFTVGLGFSLQQIVANPYVIALGNPATGAHRVTLAGAINSLGTTIGPLLLAFAIFGSVEEGGNADISCSLGDEKIAVNFERMGKERGLFSGPVFTHVHTVNGKAPYIYFAYNADSTSLCNEYDFMSVKDRGVMLVFNEKREEMIRVVGQVKKSFPKGKIPILSLEKDSYIHLLSAVSTPDGAIFRTHFFGVEKAKVPGFVLGMAFLLFALILSLSNLPSVAGKEPVEKEIGALRFPQVWLGMGAVFFYVGTEVTTQSNLQSLIKQSDFMGLDVDRSVHFVSLYWGSLMIGRWRGSLEVFKARGFLKYFLNIFIPLAAYGIVLFVNYLKGSNMQDLYGYLPFVFLLIGGFFVGKDKPARTLMVFSFLAVLLMGMGLLTTGRWSVYCFVGGGLFCSVMWPCIFSLTLAGLGKFTNQASSLLVMMIIGGALLPVLQGKLADVIGIHASYIVPLFGFLYLLFFGWKVKGILLKRGLDYDGSIGN